MGEYRDGKWVPTWGDDQFGVCDSLPQMYDKVRDKDALIGKQADEIERLTAEIAELKSYLDEGREKNEKQVRMTMDSQAENERLTAELKAKTIEVEDMKSTCEFLHETEADNERLEAVVDAVKFHKHMMPAGVLKALATAEQDESLTDKLKRLGYKEIRDAKCVMCKKPINSQVDGLFCSVACQIAATEKEDGDELE